MWAKIIPKSKSYKSNAKKICKLLFYIREEIPTLFIFFSHEDYPTSAGISLVQKITSTKVHLIYTIYIEVRIFIVSNSFLQENGINLDLFLKDKTQTARKDWYIWYLTWLMQSTTKETKKKIECSTFLSDWGIMFDFNYLFYNFT